MFAAIPAAHRTPAVVALMRDCEQLTPAHAADLVRSVHEWFSRPLGQYRCSRCSAAANWLCSLCRKCLEKEQPT